LLDDLHQRLNEVSTCSTLVAQVLIDALRISSHVAQARGLTDEIIAFALAHDESVYLPELPRIRGEQLEGADPAAAERDYREAIELARTTGARSLEQRATENLVALAAGGGDGGRGVRGTAMEESLDTRSARHGSSRP
jgi:hypothetical protein